MSSATVRLPDVPQAKSLTDMLQTKLQNPATSPEFDFHSAVDQLLADVGLTAKDSGGKLTFYGQDPIVPSSFKFGAMAAVGLAARSIALAALWKSQTGVKGRTFMSMSGKLSGASVVSSKASGKRSTDAAPCSCLETTHSSSCRSSGKHAMGVTWLLSTFTPACESATVLWTAGVAPAPILKGLHSETDRAG
jgi:hypothetical protein